MAAAVEEDSVAVEDFLGHQPSGDDTHGMIDILHKLHILRLILFLIDCREIFPNLHYIYWLLPFELYRK